MKLVYSPPSPFVRKVTTLIHHAGLDDRIELVNVKTTALSVAEALMTASLSWLPVVLRLACGRPDAWLEMPPRAEEAWPLPGTPSLRRRTVGVPRSSARKCTTFQWGDTQRVFFARHSTQEAIYLLSTLHSDDEED